MAHLMSIRRRYLLLFLLCALLTTQWASAAHTHDHDGIDADPLCQLCMHSAQFHSFVPSVSVAPLIPAHHERPLAPHSVNANAVHPRFQNPRAPPRS
jgi:hypothetical protein